jgi:hypothetical protein
MRTTRNIFSSLVLLTAGISTAAAQNIVTNPGFETGDFSGWTHAGNTEFSGVDDFAPHSGGFAAFFGPVETTGSLFQSLVTTPGTSYTFSFWLMSGSAGSPETPNFFDALWNGSSVFSLSNAGAFGYTLFSFDVLATAATTDIEFVFLNEPSFWDLDDVSVVSTVPEPATMALVASGLVAMAGAGARRRMRR